jgi:hypothetical protein
MLSLALNQLLSMYSDDFALAMPWPSIIVSIRLCKVSTILYSIYSISNPRIFLGFPYFLSLILLYLKTRDILDIRIILY